MLFRPLFTAIRLNFRTIPNVSRLVVLNSPYSTSKTNPDEDDTPVKFTTSPASRWKAKATRTGIESPRLWYEPFVIVTSLAVFLIYFTMLREENDIDQELSRTLYSRVDGLEEVQLKLSLDYNRQHNIDSTEIINRLKELEEIKSRQRPVD